MSKYKMVINTSMYDYEPTSKENWEAGTRNDYMSAINGITRTLHSLKEVKWQIELWRGNSFLTSEYSDKNSKENNGLSDKYMKFLRKNTIKYHDLLCDTERTSYLSGLGFMQGYIDIDKEVKKLKKEGIIRIPLSKFYDIRQQYSKLMKECYIEILTLS